MIETDQELESFARRNGRGSAELFVQSELPGIPVLGNPRLLEQREPCEFGAAGPVLLTGLYPPWNRAARAPASGRQKRSVLLESLELVRLLSRRQVLQLSPEMEEHTAPDPVSCLAKSPVVVEQVPWDGLKRADVDQLLGLLCIWL